MNLPILTIQFIRLLYFKLKQKYFLIFLFFFGTIHGRSRDIGIGNTVETWYFWNGYHFWTLKDRRLKFGVGVPCNCLHSGKCDVLMLATVHSEKFSDIFEMAITFECLKIEGWIFMWGYLSPTCTVRNLIFWCWPLCT